MTESMNLVVMGVAGCGKSVVGQRVAQLLSLPLIEGDDFHPSSNVEKMARGQALNDDDRAGWLMALGLELQQHPAGAVLTCSALKRRYRDTLRRAVPTLAFAQLAITPAESQRRVSSRPGHFYPPSLVASQFEALEDPQDEPRVLVVDGTLPIDVLAEQIAAWLREAGSAAAASTIDA